MREGPAPLVRRQDYAAPAFWIRSADLTFDLDPAKTIVGSRMRVERNADQPGRPAAAGRRSHHTAARAGQRRERVLPPRRWPAGASTSCPTRDRSTLEMRNTCAPEKNTELSGLYTSGGGFFTQCEAQGFRRITYFLDRPGRDGGVHGHAASADAKAYPVLLSNGNLVESRQAGQGSALCGLAVTPSQSRLPVRAGGRQPGAAASSASAPARASDHLLQVYVRAGDLDKTEHAMHSLIASVAWDEARFGLSAGPGALHDRRGERLQHGCDGEQGPEHLQHEVRSGQPRHRHRR
jgi:aminopeptidase N